MTETPWLYHYPASMPCTIDPSRYSSLIHFMEEAFAKYQNLPMCENMGKVLTYDTVDKLSKYFAAYIQQHTNLIAGSHVAIQLPNLLQYPIAILGLLRAGCIVVNINPQYTPDEMSYQFKDANVRAIIVLENFAHKLVEILPNTSIQTIIITKVGDMIGSIKGRLLNFTIKHIKKLVPAYNLPQAIAFKEVLTKGQQALFRPVALQSSDTAFLQYTGGTTGIPKGALISHGNITANLQQLESSMQLILKEGIERTIIPLPLYHIFGLSSLFAMFKMGAKCSLITNPRDIPRLVKALHKNKPTCLIGINTLLEKLLANAQFRNLDFSALKLTFSGGMKTQEHIKNQWECLTGRKPMEGYGLTESSPAVSTDVVDRRHQMPLPSTWVIIVNEQGKVVPYGTAGELLIKGPQVIRAYWQKPLETEQAFVNGWFKTGDIAIMDANGCMAIVDRKKDMINISGFNVYPNEIEHVLIGHPKVLEVGAIGVKDITLKEAIKVFIVKKDATLTAEEIIAYCRQKLVRYKVPKYVEFCNSLPKSPIGKVLRKLLKK
ncbi:AMP-binding protein [Candidatus Cardinium hertigii]|uniref:Long-chain-fatty-acid--CoA ligase n=1 Tax=Candidatus Cardinium hertigii TaxID=247481 RepID=A0A3N2QBT5_9BACT|nr:AMP-binding protein [Candidatus Cardinium hertigii]ROT47274.1 long-chain-fatty-acid--CoA ligase [Candidatus Cardinium hertigii]